MIRRRSLRCASKLVMKQEIDEEELPLKARIAAKKSETPSSKTRTAKKTDETARASIKLEVKQEIEEEELPLKARIAAKKTDTPSSKTRAAKIKTETTTTDAPKKNGQTRGSKTPIIKEEPVIQEQEESEDENVENQQNGLSEYEKQILQNVEERRRMFQMLVGDAKKDFIQVAVPVVAEKPKASQRGLKRKTGDENSEVAPLRMSLRSRNKSLEYSIDNDGEVKPTHLVSESAKNQGKNRTGPLTLSNTYMDQEAIEDSKQFIEAMIPLLEKEGELEKLPADLQDFMKLLQTFNIAEEGVAKVVKSRIYSLGWHPGTCKLLLAAGDRDGNIGFWDIDQPDDKHQGVRMFQVHKMPVNCVTFDKFNPTRLLTTSYDGYVRRLDLPTNIFDEVYFTKRVKDNWTAYHAQKDPSTLLVSQSNGDVVVVDVRESPSTVQNTIHCFENSCRTLSLHPADENLFMVCNRYGEAGIFDLRYTRPKKSSEVDLAPPVVSFPKASKGVHGAFFSPLTGQYALTTCLDDTLKLYDVRRGSEAECIKSIDHNNFTGRWLTPFKAVWHPQREDVFVVGSMEHPRRIEIFGAPDGQLLHTLKGEWLSSVACVNAFHPSVSVFAGGNASGRVHIFRP